MNAIQISAAAAQSLGDTTFPNWDFNKTSRYANRIWPSASMTLLRDHPWQFIFARSELTRVPAPILPPLTGNNLDDFVNRAIYDDEKARYDKFFGSAYRLPAGLIRLHSVSVNGCTASHRLLENGVIECKAGKPLISYSRDEPDPNNWPLWFQDLAIQMMAARLAFFVTRSKTTAEAARKEFRDAMRDATGVTGSENESPVLEVFSPSLDAR